jgi:hypothetical protein
MIARENVIFSTDSRSEGERFSEEERAGDSFLIGSFPEEPGE